MKHDSIEIYNACFPSVAQLRTIYLIYFRSRQPLLLKRWAGCV